MTGRRASEQHAEVQLELHGTSNLILEEDAHVDPAVRDETHPIGIDVQRFELERAILHIAPILTDLSIGRSKRVAELSQQASCAQFQCQTAYQLVQ
jgi:hypothetical protein